MFRKVLPALALMVLPTIASAQFEAGDWELALTGNAAVTKDTNSQDIGASLELGYFYTKELEVSFRQGVNYQRFEDSGEDELAVVADNLIQTSEDSGWGLQSLLAIDYHFDFGRWQPFVGVFGGYVYSDRDTTVRELVEVAPDEFAVVSERNIDDDSWVVGPEVGVKYFVNGTTFVFARASYTFWLDENDFDQWNAGLGIGVRL